MSILSVRGLTKTFEGNEHVLAVDGLDLTLERGEVLGLLGPSGCGKTTTLRCIAGLETPSAGTITLNGKMVVDGSIAYVPTEKRDLGMVFQSYALWPHLTVYENVEFPLIYSGVGKAARAGKIQASLEAVGLEALGARYPGELSGGQQQRVAVARAIVAEPSLVLFDEPLSNLDARLRNRVRIELKILLSRLNMTALYVTHDQGEAMALCDRIAVMSGGKILQIGTPEQVYETPSHLLVAQFLGDANILPFGPRRQRACRHRRRDVHRPGAGRGAQRQGGITARAPGDHARAARRWVRLGGHADRTPVSRFVCRTSGDAGSPGPSAHGASAGAEIAAGAAMFRGAGSDGGGLADGLRKKARIFFF